MAILNLIRESLLRTPPRASAEVSKGTASAIKPTTIIMANPVSWVSRFLIIFFIVPCSSWLLICTIDSLNCYLL